MKLGNNILKSGFLWYCFWKHAILNISVILICFNVSVTVRGGGGRHVYALI